METGSFSIATIMVGWLGTLPLAAHQVMLTTGQLGFMLYYGMAAAIAVRTSHFAGQGDMKNVRASAGAGFQLIMIMAAVVSTIIFLSRERLGGIFSDNPEVGAIVAQLTIPFIIYQFGDGMQCAYSNAPERNCRRETCSADSIHSLFRDIPPGQLPFRVRMRMGNHGNLAVIPARAHKCRADVHVEIPPQGLHETCIKK